MTTTSDKRLIVRTRVSAWGYLVALGLGTAYLAAGIAVIDVPLLPRQLGVIVDPPAWLVGVVLIAFAMFLFLVGVAELGRYLRPSAEVVVSDLGISTFGLLGERRVLWRDVMWIDVTDDLLSLKLRQKGRVPPPDARLLLSRLDITAPELKRAIRARRPDLLA